MTTLVRPTPAATKSPPRQLSQLHRRVAARAGFILAALVCWQLTVQSGLLPATSIPTATRTVLTLAKMLTTPEFWRTVEQTATGWGIGLLLCAAIAIPAGLLIGTSQFLTRSTRLVIDFLRTIPAVALTPVLLLILGSTMQMKVLLVVFGACWPLLTSTIDGVRHVDPVAADTVRSLRLPRIDRMLRLVLPTALPFVATGLRISAAIALMLTTAAEYLGSAPGLGKSLGMAQQAGAVDVMFAYLVVAGLLGVGLNVILLYLERRLLPWAPANRETVR
ncbi:ABC transporter permease [Rhodococcus jostii]|uniref:ABC-type nitrate/sulfonate/bicarbonate transport system, permease component n=1 Tax=Rhodococcus jostii TaxID=132919 RepID=A0A1H5MAD7_RHOJO|nr:ABC transporter permease [Rhodococcus jostii]SEE85631.1 ABC-type nitrate/sulfonate/bicarbonate transport system, permease component [Rhodococcus jostii]